MRRERLFEVAVGVFLLSVGALVWMEALRPRLTVATRPLDRVPLELASLRSEDTPIEVTVESMLRADFNVQRTYVDERRGGLVWLYVGYYGTERGGRPEHTPWACYRAWGWKIQQADVVRIDPERGLRANRIIVEQDGERRLVLFWYRSEQRTGILGAVGQSLDRVRGFFATGLSAARMRSGAMTVRDQ